MVWPAISANGTGKICSALAVEAELERLAASAAHAERIPVAGALQRVFVAQANHHHLVVRRRIGVAAAGDQQCVRMRTVRNRGGVLLQPRRVAGDIHRAQTVEDVAAGSNLRCDRSQQQLLVAQSAKQRLVPVAALAVRDNACHLDLVHRVDHAAGAARLREHMAQRGNLRQRPAGSTRGRPAPAGLAGPRGAVRRSLRPACGLHDPPRRRAPRRPRPPTAWRHPDRRSHS